MASRICPSDWFQGTVAAPVLHNIVGVPCSLVLVFTIQTIGPLDLVK